MAFYRLSSLELQGYKTFATKTRFEFSGAITAVVGPNGSGKSNIADSIRWVLGEQAYSVLRGRKTEDMIFSGSEKRPKASMASATVTFDNHDGWLPIDFAEVSITRRAYRDGQNEYLINQQRVRLRDVNELLAQSALAERTYTVIGQGLVDTALTLNSEERRRLFEEAAGIGLYRNRKDQSLRRLKETNRNLDRVADILAELKPRLRSLERQAKRSQEFELLRTDLRENLRSWYGYQWHQSQNELISLREAAEAGEEGLGIARQKQSEITAELNQARITAQEMRIELNSLHRNLAEMHAKREKSGRDLAVTTERKRALADQRLAIKAERQRINTELESGLARRSEVEEELARLETEHVQNTAHLDTARAELNTQISIQDEQQGDHQAQLNAVSDAKAALLNVQERQRDLTAKQESRNSEQGELQQTIETIANKVEEIVTQREELQSQISESTKEEKSLEDQLEKLRAAQKGEQENLANLESLYSVALKKKSDLALELQGLVQLQATAAGFSEGARNILSSNEGKQLSQSARTLGASMKVRSEYERAIGAALGDYLEAVVVGNSKDLNQALALIDGQDVSLALVPANLRNGAKANTVPESKGILGLASELVEVEAGMEELVRAILGDVLVVRDRSEAVKLLEEHSNWSYASLDGEYFSSKGMAQVRSSVIVNPLSMPRQIEETEKDTAKLEKQLKAHEQSLETAAQDIRNLDAQIHDVSEKLSDETTRLENLSREKQSLILQDEQLERQHEWFQSQLRAERIAQEAEKEQIEKLIANQLQIETQIDGAKQSLDKQDPVQVLPLDEYRAQVAHWEMRNALAERALQEAKRRSGEHAEQIERAETQLTGLTEREADLDAQSQQLEEDEKYLDSLEGNSGGEIEEVQASIAPTETKLNQLEIELKILQDSERELMTGVTSSERNHTQAQISLARQQETLGTLRGRIEDDFGLVAFEYEEEVSGPTPLPLGELVEHLPIVEAVEPELEERLKNQRAQIRRLGSINPEAKKEFDSVQQRFQEMTDQIKDLEDAEENLKEVIAELDLLMEREFRKTFEVVAAEFRKLFSRLFVGGSAKIILTDEEDLTNSGIDIEARLPGKRAQRLALLSGGERSLTAAALVFALLKASPTPFCVMDEVDAMLDEANVGRFTEILRELSEKTQFVIITHNRNTVQAAEVIYGITMGRDTASQVISLKLDEVDDRYSSQ